MKPDNYWFIACYISFLVISPLLAKAANALDRKKHLAFCLISAVAISLVSDYIGAVNSYISERLVAFCVIFFIAGYIRLHIAKEAQNNRLVLLVLFLSAGFMMAWPMICKASGHPEMWYDVAQMHAIPALLLSACLLMLFRNTGLGHVPWINSAAAATPGIYLIHDNEIVRPWLWQGFVQANTHLESAFFPLWSVAVILVVFIACSCIERLRRLAVDPVFSLLLNPVDALDKRITTFFAIRPATTMAQGRQTGTQSNERTKTATK